MFRPKLFLAKREDPLLGQMAPPASGARAMWTWVLIGTCVAFWGTVAYVLWLVL
jgi:hypothetical protein